MTNKDKKMSTTICCEDMLMQIGKTIFLDSIQWPHLEDSITGPPLDKCPWCGEEMPFDEAER